MSSKFFFTFLILTLQISKIFAFEFPTAEVRAKIFEKTVAELERIDGEGLPARKNRPESWKLTTEKLKEAAVAAQNPVDFGQVFRKLDATYANLHAQVVLDDKYDIAAGRLRPRIGIRFGAELIGPKQKKMTYKISALDTEMMKEFKESNRPAIGDELLFINGRPLAEWSRENFIFCKFPLREQCEANIFDHFRKAFLSWDWRQPLEYTLRRNGRTWSVKVPVEIQTQSAKQNIQKSASQVTTAENDECSIRHDRYEGFNTVYKGVNVCVFESPKMPNVTVLLITSFRYRELSKESKIQSLHDEVEQFYESYWKIKAPATQKLIIDLIDNGGGDVPVAWYQLFYNKPFQEMYVEFRKLPELENDQIRKDLFYGDKGKEIWFGNIKKTGIYQKIKVGDFLPTVPQFCATEDQSCEKGLYSPRNNGFKGQVRLMVNEWCISTCTGFVWSLKDQLGRRVKIIGIPDSGDSAYARLFIDVYLDSSKPEGFRTEVSPREGGSRQKLPEGAILRQQVTATRSTNSKGKVLSATPLKIDVWVPYQYRHYDDTWEAKVFKKALSE